MMRVALAVVAVAVLSGCTSYRPPEFDVAAVRPTERTDEGVAMVFELDAKNPNDVALPLREVDYTVELDGRTVFKGTRSAEATLRRQGTQQVRLPAVVNLTGSGEHPATTGRVPYTIKGTVTYVTPGQIAELLFDTGVRVPTVEFSDSGVVDLGGGGGGGGQ